MIRDVSAADAARIAHIYNHYVANTIVTFEEAPVTTAEMARRIGLTTAAGHPWYVVENEHGVCGWAYASPWKARSAYRFTMECTVYVAPDATGRGHGVRLYDTLFPEIAARGAHAMVGGISLPNDASVGLHERFGMTKVAHFPEVGFKFGRWIDVGYWQRVFRP